MATINYFHIFDIIRIYRISKLEKIAKQYSTQIQIQVSLQRSQSICTLSNSTASLSSQNTDQSQLCASSKIIYYLLILNLYNFLFMLTTQKPTLIYFQTRGNAQVIRCVLLEIAVDFEEIFVTCNGYLDPGIIKMFAIDIKKLPYLIHNNIAICGTFPIIKYCCVQFKRSDLLGKTLQDSILIAQIMAKQIRQRGVILHILLKGLKEVKQKELGKEGMSAVKKRIVEAAGGKQLVPLIKIFMNQNTFICGYLTVLDFYYYEKAFYGSNFIGSQYGNTAQVKLAQAYKTFFQKSEFFQKYENRLSKYKIFFPEADQSINELIKQMWMGDPKYLCCVKNQK